MSYNERMQTLAKDYQTATGSVTFTLKEIGAWAVREGLWEPGQDAILRQFCDDMGRALREEYVRDPQGRRVRATSVDTSNPAINGRFKTGHYGGDPRPGLGFESINDTRALAGHQLGSSAGGRQSFGDAHQRSEDERCDRTERAENRSFLRHRTSTRTEIGRLIHVPRHLPGKVYLTFSPGGKSACSFVRQLRGPHLSTCA